MAPKRQRINPQEAASLYKPTGPRPDDTQPDQADPVQSKGVGLRASEWARLKRAAEELGTNRNSLVGWALREFLKRYEAGELPVRTETRRTLPGL